MFILKLSGIQEKCTELGANTQSTFFLCLFLILASLYIIIIILSQFWKQIDLHQSQLIVMYVSLGKPVLLETILLYKKSYFYLNLSNCNRINIYRISILEYFCVVKQQDKYPFHDSFINNHCRGLLKKEMFSS